jgi:hypothetical protein
MNFKRSTVFAAAAVLLAAAGCSRKSTDDPVLARIGDRTITKKEYTYRTELTIRPKYPALKSDSTKVELLNNLIAEKLFAIEAGDDNALLKRQSFRDYIRGIREQTMRDQLYNEVATKKVRTDTTELKRLYKMAGREYDLEFYTIRRKETARRIQEEILMHPDRAGRLFDGLGAEGTPVPRHTIAWKDQENDLIHDALFDRPVPVDTVIGPIRIGANEDILMKVKGWTDHPIIGGEEMVQRWNEVKEKTIQRKARYAWERYMGRLLGGKAIKFNPPVLSKMADMAWMMYSAPSDSDAHSISRNLFSATKDSLTADPYGNEAAFLKEPFFTVAGKAWTVERFKRELAAHPLVYRRKDIKKENFRREFRNAVTDFMRDQFLNHEAYQKRLDRSDYVRRNAELWQDALVANYYQNDLLERLAKRYGVEGQPVKLKKVYEDYVDSLFQANADRIHFDSGMLNAVKLSNIDFYAFKPGVPFPAATPPFPMMITKSN